MIMYIRDWCRQLFRKLALPIFFRKSFSRTFLIMSKKTINYLPPRIFAAKRFCRIKIMADGNRCLTIFFEIFWSIVPFIFMSLCNWILVNILNITCQGMVHWHCVVNHPLIYIYIYIQRYIHFLVLSSNIYCKGYILCIE